ncbi:NUDIX domain-containing protein [Streptomyces sp. NPDC047061]|uniref:NUDIX domain-containing protein n=1 Tax=Streptomyces sp. NPDC047061 TaxID=3154605 RepID=UPI0033E4ADAE
MASEQTAGNTVDAVVVYDGRLLMVNAHNHWELPSGAPEPAESATAAAARVVYELTGYLVDGSTPLGPAGTDPSDPRSFVVCQLLTETPSDTETRLPPEQLRWTPIPEALDAGLPEPVRVYLKGHTPV